MGADWESRAASSGLRTASQEALPPRLLPVPSSGLDSAGQLPLPWQRILEPTAGGWISLLLLQGRPRPTDSRSLSPESLSPHQQEPAHSQPRPYPLTPRAFVPSALCTMAGAPRAPNSCCGRDLLCCGARRTAWGLGLSHLALKGSV